MKGSKGNSRYFLALSYLIVGVAWVAGADYMMGYATPVSLAAHLIASLKGIVFVVATSALLFVVQSRQVAVKSPARLGGGALRPLLILLITFAGVALAGVVLYQQQRTEVRQRASATLVSTAAMTARQVESWVAERRTKLEFAGRNPLLAHAILNRRTQDPDIRRPDLQGGIEGLRQSEGFDSVQVFSPAGRPVAHAGRPVAMTPRLRFWSRGAAATGRVVMSDLYVPADADDGKPVVDFVVTIMHDDLPNVAAGILVGRADPDRRLFPILAESVAAAPGLALSLTRREGDAVAVLLPPTRRAGGVGGSYQHLVSDPQAVVQQVTAGRLGAFPARDEQGAATLASGHAIGGTPWTLVATVPQETFLAPLRRAGRLGLLLMLAGFVVSGGLATLWWRGERQAMAERLDAAARRSNLLKEHFAIAGRFVHDIVLLLDEDDATIVEANDRAVEAYGYARQDLLARTIFDLRPAGSVEQAWARQRFAEMNLTGGGSFVTRHWRRDGTSFPLEVGSRYCELDGRRYVQVVGHDITQRIEHEERLAALSAERDRVLERLQRQFDQMPTACVVLSAEGTVLQINPAHERVYGYAAEHLIGRNMHELLRAPKFARQVDLWFEQLRKGADITPTGVFENFTRAGDTITCRWTITALRDDKGAFSGMIGMAEDITEQLVAERELRKAHDHLEERVAERTTQLEHAKDAAEHSDRVKSAFLSTMSHELRTPLNSILGFTDVLLQGLSGPLAAPQQRQLQIVRDSASHLRSLIEDVLDVSRIEAGQFGLEFTDVDLADLVTRRVEAFGPEFERKGIKLQVQADEPLPMLRSDRKRTSQIVNNLLSNALKFTDQGAVTVELRCVAEFVELRVADTGVGIPASALATLFTPFTQVIRPGGRMHEGTGLGLAIARNLARALGGDVTAESEVGRGSCFLFRLPLVANEVDAASASGLFARADIHRALASV